MLKIFNLIFQSAFIEKIFWERAAILKGRVYRLPGGIVGREFTNLLADEYDLLASAIHTSERVSMFGKLILQKDKNIRKAPDIKRLLKRRMQMWRDNLFEQLIQEAELCDKKLPNSVSKMDDDEAILNFSRLVLLGKLRQAVRFLTDRAENGGILQPDDDAGKGKTVIEVLQAKHPNQADPHADAFIECAELPELIDVDVTADHMLKVASSLSGGAGISGLDASQWHQLLL